MTTASKPEPLAVMEQMFNEVLIQTGKALRATKDGSKNIHAAVTGTVQSRVPEHMMTYHDALSDIESEITRAKAVLMRDLEKLRAARLPAPAPAPAPAPQPVKSQAPVMDLPSSAAHTTNPPPFVPSAESKHVAPFPDMGAGDVVDLTLGDKKPSPRVPPGAIKPSMHKSPSIKNEMKPSPKTPSKAIPKGTPPAKVTPVPPPQIPRLQAQLAQQSQAHQGPQRKPSASQPAPRGPPAQAAAAPPDSAKNPTLGQPAGRKPGEANAAPSGGELNFTDMQFSLAPSANEPQNAPPAPMAPMPEFDLSSFAPQEGNHGLLSIGNFSADSAHTNTNANVGANTNANANANTNVSGPNGGSAAVPNQNQAPKDAPKGANSNMDDLFALDSGRGAGDSMDLDLDLDKNGVPDSNFDDLFSYPDADMEQFDDAYFGL